MEELHLRKTISAEKFLSALEGKEPDFIFDSHFLNSDDMFSLQTCIVFSNVDIEGNIYLLDKNNPLQINLPVEIGNGTCFRESIFLQNIESKKPFNIIGGKFFSNVTIAQNTKLEQLNISGGEFEGEIKIKGGEFGCLKIYGAPEFKNSFDIKGGKFEKINISLKTPILFNIEESQTFLDEKINIYKLSFNGHLHEDSRFNFFDKLPKNLSFNNLVNEGKILFRDLNQFYEGDIQFIKLSNILEIKNSILGDVSFVNCDLENYKLNFQSSNISAMNIDGTNFPSLEYLKNGKNKNPQQLELLLFQLKKLYESRGNFISALFYHEQVLLLQLENTAPTDEEKKKTIFSQLKLMQEQAGNTIKAIEYRGQELNSYRKLLRKTKYNFGEKISLNLNYLSSFYGNHWGQATLITLFVNFLFFTSYCMCLGFRLGSDFSLFWKLFSYSLEFLNPLRKVDFLKDAGVVSDITNWARFFDYLSRIFISYFAYQSIQAFRKYGKKSS